MAGYAQSRGDRELLIAATDVDYRDAGRAVAACITFRGWQAASAATRSTVDLRGVAAYESGEFYRRELPCLLRVLSRVERLDIAVIDGYAWLGDGSRPGLGAHLFEALGRNVPVVGVAKNRHKSATCAVEVVRGKSDRPLYVTAAGMDAREAADGVRSMHGDHRLPALLKEVDRLGRDYVAPPPLP